MLGLKEAGQASLGQASLRAPPWVKRPPNHQAPNGAGQKLPHALRRAKLFRPVGALPNLYFQTQGGARSSLALGWLVGGPLALDATDEENASRHAEYWMAQAFPVLVVIRSSEGEARWMEVRDWLKRASANGRKPVKQIVFEGERFDVMSVRRRETILGTPKL